MGRLAALWIGALGLLALAVMPLACTQARPPYVANPAAPLVRVRIVEREQQVSLSATEPPTVTVGGVGGAAGTPARRLNIPSGAAVNVTLTSGGWSIGNVPVGAGEMLINPATDGTVSINGKRYHGKYRFVANSAGNIDVINDVDVDSYLKGVIPEECLRNWNIETYKAQAIVARTYALYEARTAKNQYWDLHDDTRSQVYGGIGSENAKSRQAVDETAGVVLVYGPAGQEKIFKAYFSACCGGISMSAADAFNEPYIPPLSDQNNHSLCSAAPRYNWGPITISKEELTRRVQAWGASKKPPRPEKNLATISRIDIQATNRWGRPTRFVIVDGAGNRYSLTGEELRWAVNTNAAEGTRLNSSFVKPLNEPDVVRFVDGHGHGHGVGLCQWCSEIRAESGMRHEDIVLSAFQRAKLARAY